MPTKTHVYWADVFIFWLFFVFMFYVWGSPRFARLSLGSSHAPVRAQQGWMALLSIRSAGQLCIFYMITKARILQRCNKGTQRKDDRSPVQPATQMCTVTVTKLQNMFRSYFFPPLETLCSFCVWETRLFIKASGRKKTCLHSTA